MYTREQIIQDYINMLGTNWKKYGVEIVVAADRFVKYATIEPTDKKYKSYLRTILYRLVSDSEKNSIKFLQLFPDYDVPIKLSSLCYLLKADIERDLGECYYQVALDKFGSGFSVKEIADRRELTTQQVKWRLEKIRAYTNKWIEE
jgi:hypothetical protein